MPMLPAAAERQRPWSAARPACRRWLAAWLLLAATAAPAQTLESLHATTIEVAPAAQVAQAQALLSRLRAALEDCDGGRLAGLLPAWELSVLPALAFDALHDDGSGGIAGMNLQQLALSPYGRAAVQLRVAGGEVDAQDSARLLQAWCSANRGPLQALLRGIEQADRWQWLRQDELQLLSGCAWAGWGDGRISLLRIDEGWRMPLLESVETWLPQALAGRDAALREELLQQRRGFLDRHPQVPPAPRAADPDRREALTELALAPELERYALLVEQRAALPPCH